MGPVEAILVLLVVGVVVALVYSGARRRAPVQSTSQGSGPASPGSVAVVERTNGLAITSIVVGALGAILAFALTPLVLPIAAIVAIVLGYRALREIDLSGGRQGGRGLALLAVTLGWIEVAAGVILVIVVYFLLQEAQNESPYGLGAHLAGLLANLRIGT